MKKSLFLLALLLTTAGVGSAVAQVAIRSIPADAVVHRGVYRYADQQWTPGEPAAQKALATLFGNTTGTGGFQPSNQLPGVDIPATFLDWATSDGGIVEKIDVSYATDEPVVRADLSLFTGTTDIENGVEILLLNLDNLPGSQSGNIEVFEVTVDISEENLFLPPGPFGCGFTVFEDRTGWLTANGGTGITDFFRILGEQANRTVNGFFAQFFLRLQGNQVGVWYVDNVAPAGGDGSRATPFNTMAEAEAASAPGDVIFTRTGAGPYDHIALQAGQKFLTEGATFGDIPAGDRPTMGGLTLHDDVEVNDVIIDGGSVEATGLTGQININRTLITGGDGGIDILGSGGTFTFTDTEVTSGGLNVDGGSSDVNFDGSSSISQATDNSAINVTNSHTGTLTFDGDINGTNGDGLQFDNADGTYNFNGTTTLNGGDAGIDILGGSAGTFTFSSNTSINNPSGDAFNVNGDGTNSPGVTYNGDITNDTGRAVGIGNTISGNTITFQNGTIADTGTGIILLNVGQDIILSGDTELSGSRGIDILGGSAGTFTFSNTDINNNSITVDGSEANLNHDGTISGNTRLQFDNANGSYDFNGDVRLGGGDAGIDILGGSAGTFTFGNVTISDPDSAGVKIRQAQQINFMVKDTLKIKKKGAEGIAIQGGSGTFTFGNIDITGPGPCARFEDTDIVHVVTEDIVCDGKLGFRGLRESSFRVGGGLKINEGGIEIDQSNNFNFNVGTVDINDAPDEGIKITGVSNSTVTLDSLRITGAGGAGFRADSLDALTLLLKKLAIFDNRGPCVEMKNVNRSTVEIDESECEPEVDQHGYFIIRNLDTIYTNGPASYSLGISSGDAVHIEDSEIVFNYTRLEVNGGRNGMYVAGNSGKVKVEGGTIENTTETGASFERADEIELSNLMIVNTGQGGVRAKEYLKYELVNVQCTGIQGPCISATPGDESLGAAVPRSKTADPLITPAVLLDGLSVADASDDAVFIETGGSQTVDVSVTNSTINTTGPAGITVQTTGASTALVTLTGNDVTAATNAFVLNQQDNSTILLAGFDGGDATAFIQSNNEGTPSVVVNGTVGAGPASDTADLRLVDKDVSDQSPAVGDTLVYTIRTTNAGPAEASAVVVTDLLPAELTYLPGTITVNSQAKSDAAGDDEADFGGTAANTLTVNAATFAVGDTLVIVFRAIVEATANGRVITNTATVTGADPDVLAGNNDAHVDIGIGTATAVEDELDAVPETFALYQNYPNPFNPETTIHFDVKERTRVRLQVFNVLGQIVQTLVDEELATGTYRAVFDARGLPSGSYFYRIEAGNFTETRPMILLK